MFNQNKILFFSLSGMLCLGSSLVEAVPTDNLQDTRRQAQERQEWLEQPRVQMEVHWLEENNMPLSFKHGIRFTDEIAKRIFGGDD